MEFPFPPPPPQSLPLRGIDRNCAGLAYLLVLEAYRPKQIIRNSQHDNHE